ncbi:MAG: SMC-Scp complex subunit ScpB [Candidatus Binataceae bacterium]|nr:SMC-Scp complex subunit ScpB [Candidatus Binataceae bacterium]
MEEERLKAIIESLLLAAGEPVALARFVAVLESVPKEAIKQALSTLALEYANGARGIVLEEVAGGYQLRTSPEHAFYVRKLLAAKPPRLSRSLMETLAIIAYRQPITRPEIEQLRGVDSGGVLETLLERGLTKIAGRKEAPGRPIVYATTSEFLEVFSLRDLGSLPDLQELKELEVVTQTPEAAAAVDPESHLASQPEILADETSGSDNPAAEDPPEYSGEVQGQVQGEVESAQPQETAVIDPEAREGSDSDPPPPADERSDGN